MGSMSYHIHLVKRETARCGGRRREQEPRAPAGALSGGSQGQGAPLGTAKSVDFLYEK